MQFSTYSVLTLICSQTWSHKRVAVLTLTHSPSLQEYPKCHLIFPLSSQVATVVKNPPADARDTSDEGSIPGLGRSPAVGNSNPLPHSCLENSMDRGARWATVQGVAKCWTRLSHWTQHSSFSLFLHSTHLPTLPFRYFTSSPLFRSLISSPP